MRKPYLQPQQPSNQRPAESLSLTTESNQIPQREVLTVSQLNRKAKQLMELELGSLWIEGEISNFIQASSGHWYFTLKDNSAQIKCAIFKFKNRRLQFLPKEGDKVIVKGKVSLYEARGDYQMIADYMEPSGLGKLQLALNELINQLQQQGLFSSSLKKQLPFLPSKIGVITSPTGAAIHDVLTVLSRHCPMVPVIIYPTQVQGENASSSIIRALKTAQQRNECDVILMTRGGGSLEDLWCFNDERLAREIAKCAIPIVAAIGHEVDVTITELVADLRAATPSAAAELMVPDQQVLWQKTDILLQDLNAVLQYNLGELQSRLNIARLKLRDPEQTILKSARQLEQFRHRLLVSFRDLINARSTSLDSLTRKLQINHPKEKLLSKKHQIDRLENRLKNSLAVLFEKKVNQLAISASNLNTLSPLSTLARGYSITRDKSTQSVISKMDQVEKKQLVSILLSDGEIDCQVL